MNQDELFTWEEEAQNAVKNALALADFDDIRGVISLPEDEINLQYWGEFNNVDDLRYRLEEIYDSAWYAHVPFESGEAVFDGDSTGFVIDVIGDRGIEEFFEAIAPPQQSIEKIITSHELIEDTLHSKILRIDLQDINQELIQYLAKNPHYMRELEPRKFEELVAELFRNMGYTVELTPRSRDGGLDIIAIDRSDLGSALTLIECKRYSASNRVGVEVVRGLYGVVEQKRATRGLIATTSFFTKDAMAFRDSVQYRLALADFDQITQFLHEWKSQR